MMRLLILFGLCSIGLMTSGKKNLYGSSKEILWRILKKSDFKIYSEAIDQKDLSERFIERLNACVEGAGHESDAEKASCRHQLDLIHIFRDLDGGRLPEAYHLDQRSWELGVIHSDMGKLAGYKRFLTDPSPASDLLIDTLTGCSTLESSGLIQDLLGGQTLLNSSFGSNDEIRGLFSDIPAFLNYFHEFPGLLDAVLAFESGLISGEQFKTQVKVTLFHNGPAVGFWKKFSDEILPTMINKSHTYDLSRVKLLLSGTPYEEQNQSSLLHYPESSGFEAILHNLYDRVSQGTRGGLDKIFKELSFLPTISIIEEFKNLSFSGTMDQIATIEQFARQDQDLNPAQKRLIGRIAEHSIGYLDRFQTLFKSLVRVDEIWSYEYQEKAIRILIPFKLYRRSDQIYTQIDREYIISSKSSFERKSEIAVSLMKFYKEFEKLYGDPMILSESFIETNPDHR